MRIHHINCGILQKENGPRVLCHCLLLEDISGLTLIDTGIGVQDALDPMKRIGQQLIELAGFKFNMEDTAVYQIRRLGLQPEQVNNCIISHLDPDHIGGLADFPQAKVHVSLEEYECFQQGNYRYRQEQLSHKPLIQTYHQFNRNWFGLRAEKLAIHDDMDILLVSLRGHTKGHCGVAIQEGAGWLFYIGDAYYLRDELFVENHPVNELVKQNAMDDARRLETLVQLKRLAVLHPEIKMFGYHDVSEF